jgi:hypothetical protein
MTHKNLFRFVILVSRKKGNYMTEKNRPRNEEEVKEEENKKIPPAADDTNRERLDNEESERK